METNKKAKSYKLHIALFILSSIFVESLFHDQVTDLLPAVAQASQQTQAEELLKPSILKKTKQVHVSSEEVFKIVQKHLPKKYKKRTASISKTIIQEAKRHGMDPLFLMAVIMTESSFNPEARGRHGEIGLMQILPKTAEWIAQRQKMKGRINLKSPETNIKIGAAYLAKLRMKFNYVGNRYIAAYNMGSKNVRRLVASNVEPYIYSDKVLKNYETFYVQIHRSKSTQKVASL